MKIVMVGIEKALHPEMRTVHRKTGEVHQQTFHVRPEESKQTDPRDYELTLMSMMDRFATEEAARDYFEKMRWPNGPTCPFCGNTHVGTIAENPKKRVRAGLHKCVECKKQFTVTVGTIMESSHVPMHKWLLAFYMMCASKTQVAALQLQRQLEIGSYQTALFVCHRIRTALLEYAPEHKLTGTVEADETYIGGKAEGKGRGYVKNKTPVISAVERGGDIRSVVVDEVTGKIISEFLGRNVDRSAHLNTDEAQVYVTPGKKFASHDVVSHSNKEYSRDDPETGRKATTNTVEGYYGNTKRSIAGTHHAISPQHTDLYVAELDYKYNTRKMSDSGRTAASIPKIAGKRLKLKDMFRRRYAMREKEPVKKGIVEDKEIKMPSNEFDDLVRKVLFGPVNPGAVKAKPVSPIKVVVKGKKAKGDRHI